MAIESPIDDPEYKAFLALETAGKFRDLPPGTYVAIFNSEWLASALTFELLLSMQAVVDAQGEIFVTQVNIEKVPLVVAPGPRLAPQE